MKRLAPLLLASLLAPFLAAGCGSDSTPSVSQVTVTVRQAGAVLQGATVNASAAMDRSGFSPTPVGTLATQTTNASGQAVFAVPASTTTGELCFSVTVSVGGAVSEADNCATLNALSPSVVLDLL